jgi:FdhD protein
MGRVTARHRVVRIRDGRTAARADAVAVEEPLLVRVGEATVTLTMRTPGADFDLVAGWLVGEGAVAQPADIVGMRLCRDEQNTVEVVLAEGVEPPAPRAFATTSACGVCGADTVLAVRDALRWAVADDRVTLELDTLAKLPDLLRAHQRAFDRTGGLHAAGLFTATGEPVYVREDVGRHNAVDKVVGALLLEGELPATDRGLFVSGRASVEMVQKAWAAGFSAVVAVSAPTALAVAAARRANLMLAGFVTSGRLNVYAPERF